MGKCLLESGEQQPRLRLAGFSKDFATHLLPALMAIEAARRYALAVSRRMCDPYRSFAQRFFPNARLVADKFHVLRLLSPHINRRRRLIEGDRRSAALRRLLLRSRFRLEHAERYALDQWLTGHPELRALYDAKEAMHSLYRIRGRDRASQALTVLTDRLASSPLPELQTFRRTLMRWRREILAYFGTGLTNGRTEGFNNKAKLVKKRAYGYRSFRLDPPRSEKNLRRTGVTDVGARGFEPPTFRSRNWRRTIAGRRKRYQPCGYRYIPTPAHSPAIRSYPQALPKVLVPIWYRARRPHARTVARGRRRAGRAPRRRRRRDSGPAWRPRPPTCRSSGAVAIGCSRSPRSRSTSASATRPSTGSASAASCHTSGWSRPCGSDRVTWKSSSPRD